LTQVKAAAPAGFDHVVRPEGSDMRRFPPVLALLLVSMPVGAEETGGFISGGDAGLDLRYRFETARQDDKPSTAEANTLRLRARLESGVMQGFKALVEADHIEALGGPRYDDTRNGLTNYPVIADPQGTDFNQYWLQWRGAKETGVRAGRQRIQFGNERFVGAVGWRQNEQTFDALRLDTKAIPGAVANYVYVDRVQRVFGPDSGVPPATLASDSHLLDVRSTSLPVGTLVFHAELLDFEDAPQLSLDTVGLRYEGERGVMGEWKGGWALEYAQQRDAGANAAEVDAYYGLAELRLQTAALGFTAGYEVLSGERGTFTATTNPAFQTPLATLHAFQGWADKFLTTPSAGIEDLWLGVNGKLAGWNLKLVWHDFGAEATGAGYGSEWDASVSRKFAERYELLVKYADYSADELLTDTRKVWVQVAAAF
jgi:hypothetical protein